MICIFGMIPRCGSTSISEAIHENMIGAGNFLAEPFAKKYDNWGTIPNEPKIKPSINNIQQISKTYNITLIKTLEFDLTEEDNLKLLSISDSSVFLYREFFVDYFFSKWMSENFFKKTGKSHFYIDHIRSDNNFFTLERDPIDIPNMISSYKQKQEKMLRYLNGFNFDAVVSYEKFFSNDNKNRKENFTKLCKSIGINMTNDLRLKHLDTDRKHNSYKNYQKLIPNWEEVIELKDQLILKEKND